MEYEFNYENAPCVRVMIKGEVVFTWNDDANIDYPEDLTWGREIGELFHKAFALGYKQGKGE